VRQVNQRSIYYCPFCDAAIAETNLQWDKPPRTPAAVEYDRVEAVIREHLLSEHPIRWRLNRRLRRAMRQSRLAVEGA
jgi:hypothetical protein